MGRLSFATIVVFWLAAMSWLFLTKIFPVLDGTPSPTPGFTMTEEPSTQQACWGIECQGEPIGYASNQTISNGQGRVDVSSSVRLQDIPIGELLADLLSSWSMLARWASPVPVDTTMTVATETEMVFEDGALRQFRSTVRVDDLGPLFQLSGMRQPGGLQVEVLPGKLLRDSGVEQPLFSRILPLPEEALIIDAFSPYSQLQNLRLGKRWQMRSYRAFPPSQPIRIVDARVESSEMILWEGEITSCFVISFTEAQNGGPTAAASSVGRMWVDDDGTILKQLIQVGGIELEFMRKPNAFCQNKLTREAAP